MMPALEAVEVALLEHAAGVVGRLEELVVQEPLHRLVDLLVVGQRQAGQDARDVRASAPDELERRPRRELARGDRRLRLVLGRRPALVDGVRLGAAADGHAQPRLEGLAVRDLGPGK